MGFKKINEALFIYCRYLVLMARARGCNSYFPEISVSAPEGIYTNSCGIEPYHNISLTCSIKDELRFAENDELFETGKSIYEQSIGFCKKNYPNDELRLIRDWVWSNKINETVKSFLLFTLEITEKATLLDWINELYNTWDLINYWKFPIIENNNLWYCSDSEFIATRLDLSEFKLNYTCPDTMKNCILKWEHYSLGPSISNIFCSRFPEYSQIDTTAISGLGFKNPFRRFREKSISKNSFREMVIACLQNTEFKNKADSFQKQVLIPSGNLFIKKCEYCGKEIITDRSNLKYCTSNNRACYKAAKTKRNRIKKALQEINDQRYTLKG